MRMRVANLVSPQRIPRSRAGVLIVAGEGVSESMTRSLAVSGHRWESVPSVHRADGRLAAGDLRLVLVDLSSLGEAAEEVLDLVPRWSRRLPVILTAARGQRRIAQRGLSRGAWAYALEPLDPDEVAALVARGLESYRLRGELEECRQSRQRLEEELQRSELLLRRQQEDLFAHLTTAQRFRDGETYAHVERIGLYASELAAGLGWEPRRAADLGRAARLHDVGKIGLPDRVLLKPAQLTAEEFEVVKGHTEIGAEILARPDLPLFELAREIALNHHERWNGSGYPHGLAGAGIPASARIVAVADVYDALVHPRPYRPGLPEREAVGWMREVAPEQFDPEIFACFLDLLPELRRIRRELVDEVDAAAAASPVPPPAARRRPAAGPAPELRARVAARRQAPPAPAGGPSATSRIK